MNKLQTQLRRTYATLLTAVSEAESRGLATNTGYDSLPQLLTDVLRVRPSEAQRYVRQAVAITPARIITGGELRNGTKADQPPCRTWRCYAADIIDSFTAANGRFGSLTGNQNSILLDSSIRIAHPEETPSTPNSNDACRRAG